MEPKPRIALLIDADNAAAGRLGANPVNEAINALGLLALIFLVASLACTPLKETLGWTWPVRIRRMLGRISR